MCILRTTSTVRTVRSVRVTNDCSRRKLQLAVRGHALTWLLDLAIHTLLQGVVPTPFADESVQHTSRGLAPSRVTLSGHDTHTPNMWVIAAVRAGCPAQHHHVAAENARSLFPYASSNSSSSSVSQRVASTSRLADQKLASAHWEATVPLGDFRIERHYAANGAPPAPAFVSVERGLGNSRRTGLRKYGRRSTTHLPRWAFAIAVREALWPSGRRVRCSCNHDAPRQFGVEAVLPQ